MVFRSVSRLASSSASAPFLLPDLPYAKEALQPFISAETLTYHHQKHHQAYVTKLNQLVAEAPAALGGKSLEELVRTETGTVFNQAAQVWNHTFYWNCLKPKGGGEPSGTLGKLIVRDFESVARFRDAFTAAATSHFGSGWAWLVWNEKSDKLEIVTGHDAMNPVRDGSGVPLLTCDVWEHAYYIDTRNDRPAYVKNWWNLVNWEFANAQLGLTKAKL